MGWNNQRTLYSYRRITPTERAKAIHYIKNTYLESREKRILELFFIEGMNATAISRHNDPDIVCISNRNKGKPLSATSILNIIYKHFPEFKNRHASKSDIQQQRIDLIRKREKEQSVHIKACAWCGSTENLEEHHMIPLFMGGTNDDRNLIYMCNRCHKDVSKYQNELRKKTKRTIKRR